MLCDRRDAFRRETVEREQERETARSKAVRRKSWLEVSETGKSQSRAIQERKSARSETVGRVLARNEPSQECLREASQLGES